MYEEIYKELTDSFKEIKISCDETNNILVINISGYIDTYNHLSFLETIKKIINKSKLKKIILDCEKINYISSSGVGALIEILKRSKEISAKLYLMKLDNKNKEVLNLLGFTSFFVMINKIEEIN
jgi:anti-anti-sigma factor